MQCKTQVGSAQRPRHIGERFNICWLSLPISFCSGKVSVERSTCSIDAERERRGETGVQPYIVNVQVYPEDNIRQ